MIDAISLSVRVFPAFTPTDSVTLDEALRDVDERGALSEWAPLNLSKYVLGATVMNTINGVGTFVLQFDAMRDELRGFNLAERLRPRSAVAIGAVRASVSRRVMPIMLGIIDTATYSEEWRSAAPVRAVQVTGRILSALLMDHQHYFHPIAARAFDDPTKLGDYRQCYTINNEKLLRDEISLRAMGMLAINRELLLMENLHPVAIAKALFDYYVVSGITPQRPDNTGGPFIKYNILARPDKGAELGGRSLADLIRLKAERSDFFDRDGAIMQARVLPTMQMPKGTLWDVLKVIAESPFSELFMETYGESFAKIHTQVVIRKPPWRGHIEADGRVNAGASGPPARHESLFDETYGTWNLAENSIIATGDEILSRNAITRVSRPNEVYTAYEVTPMIMSDSGNSTTESFWKARVPPLFEEGIDSPSTIARYGIRVKQVTTRMISTIGPDASTPKSDGDIVSRCCGYQALMREWFHRTPEFWEGSIVIRGNPKVKVGMVFVDVDCYGPGSRFMREYYITGYQHMFNFSEKEPQFVTVLQLERGWDIARTQE